MFQNHLQKPLLPLLTPKKPSVRMNKNGVRSQMNYNIIYQNNNANLGSCHAVVRQAIHLDNPKRLRRALLDAPRVPRQSRRARCHSGARFGDPWVSMFFQVFICFFVVQMIETISNMICLCSKNYRK